MAHHYGEYAGLEIPTPKTRKTIMVSGGSDPIHFGHCRMIQEAAKHGELIVVANSDDWLKRKKGFAFMPFKERAEIISYMKGVHMVVEADDDDGTICETLRKYKPDIFANGGDRTVGNTPEMKVCNELGITMLWGIGGGKIQSSSDLVSNAQVQEEAFATE